MKNQNPNRRSFVKSTTIAAGTGILLSPTSRVLGANDRVNLGIIGCGGRGTWHCHDIMARKNDGKAIEIVAISDIYEARKKRAKEITGAEVYHDYRELIDRPDIDAVVIATPDHWHATMAIDAMKAGKDLYLEKPMTRYWHEAKEVYYTSKKLDKVVQIGNGGASNDMVWKARRAIEEGMIGKTIWVQSSSARNSRDGEWNWGIDRDAGPNNIDWKAFLGPAENRPWDPERYFRFRKFWDYSGGIATDLIYHALGSLMVALKAEFPTRVTATGGIWDQPDREVPDTFMFNADYPSDYSINIPTSMSNSHGVRTMIRGRHATIMYPPSGMYEKEPWLTVEAEDPFAEEFEKKYGARKVIIEQEEREDHMDNFCSCVRSRKQPHMDALKGYKTAIAICMSVMSYRQQKMIFFDADKEKVVHASSSKRVS